jgi:hypothetical protein
MKPCHPPEDVQGFFSLFFRRLIKPKLMIQKSYASILLLISFLFFSFTIQAADKGTIKGTVSDASTGELLIGVNIGYAPGKGVISDENGAFEIQLDYGEYDLQFSYVGFGSTTKKVKLNKAEYLMDVKLSPEILKEVEIVADIARTRETPVAFSEIKPKVLEEELANQDLPLILNRTPGVYATSQGGGDGDSRINIRGFSQRNVAVMIDGVPVNDMENGWVYWSNWFGIDQAVRSIQVQRGLSASKLALPSVGGTMNIITRGIDQDRMLSVKQDFGNDGYMRSSFGISTGLLDNGWAVSFAGAYKQGNGWADQTWTQGFFGYLRIDKKIGNHNISFSGYGAPQSHGQRSYKSSIAEFDTNYAKQYGITPDQYIPGKVQHAGLRYNKNWGYLNRWSIQNGDTVYQGTERINDKKNYYFKPQISLRDFWRINKNMYMSNIIYMSYGSGGGTGLSSSSSLGQTLPDGTLNFQKVYDENVTNRLNGTEGGGTILRSSINNHQWFGAISTLDWQITDKLNFAGGIDLRTYRGEHYRVAYDMLGANYIEDLDGPSLNNQTTDDYQIYQNDIFGYHNDGLVRWGGLFGQLEWKTDKLMLFTNITGAVTGYKRVDYFLKKDLVIDGQVYEQAVGYTRQFNLQSFVWETVMDTAMIGGQAYTVNSAEARHAESDWHYIPGYTFKAGANYNINDKMNVFMNIGMMDKAPRFRNIFDYSNQLYKEIKNEKIRAIELGYNYFNKWMTLNANAYITEWKNKPADNATSVTIDDQNFRVNINGMNALHKGVEFELGLRPVKGMLLETVVSLGDWRWTSADSAEVIDDRNNQVIETVYFDANGVRVGDAAQTQLRQSIRYEIIKGLSLRASVTYFGNYYSNFDPLSLDPKNNQDAFDDDGNPRQSWQIPSYYLVDAGFAYTWRAKDATRFKVQLSVLNLLDEFYISDAQNNDRYSGQTYNNFDAASAGVFFGQGRRIVTSFAISL